MEPNQLDLQNELNFARQLMSGCAQITRSVQEQHIVSQSKSDRSPVTIADYAVQAYVAQAIRAHFPADILVGEESSSTLLQDQDLLTGVTAQVQALLPQSTSQQICEWIDDGKGQPSTTSRFWVIDPVDGTKGFLRRMQYVTALALIIDSQVVLSVLGCPNVSLYHYTGGLVYAAISQGAFWQPFEFPNRRFRIHVSSQTAMEDARLVRSFEDSHTNSAQIESLVQSGHISADPVRMDSQAKYVILAAGQADLLLRLPPDDRPDYRENIWDQAPAYRVILEAGGQMTDALGQPLDFSTGVQLTHNQGIVATNGHLHAQTLNILEKIRA